ncbi:hydroxysqualene dehydroxylase HpnE [Modestobacter sp. NPDC049651]|uniref:hydroxysqualene dehydroxylase HpnE n=1 Tax=unclassified Modestobacter TaxID=2643866 RepID=UPI003405BC5F
MSSALGAPVHAASDAGRRVVVVGGGLAGLTAGLALADAGCAVTLLEAKPRLGGLTTSFRRSSPVGELDVDTGQHVFLRCCTAYLELVERLGVRDQVHLQPRLDIPVRTPGRDRTWRLRRSGAPAPFHLSSSLARYSVLGPADRLRAVRGALALRRVDRDDPATDAQSFGGWLARHGQNAATTAAMWDLVGIATLNARAEDASLALAATVFQDGLLTDPAAADIGWALAPLGALHGTAGERALSAAGAQVRTGAKVTGLDRDGAGWTVAVRDADPLAVDAVVLAAPPPVTEALLPAGALDLPAGWADRLGAVPIVNVHVVLDRPVLAEPFLAGVGSPVQWVFDRTRQSGLADGRHPGAQYLAVSLSAAADLVDRPAAELVDEQLAALRALLPAAAGAQVLDAFVTRERTATFAPLPGNAAHRPGPRTRAPGLVVAGAWTATGWPATMEGAVRSGAAAAQDLLAQLPSRTARGGTAA